MSKLSTRIILSALIGLSIVVAVFVSVKAASTNVAGKSLGMYVLSGGLVNQLQSQSASEAQEQAPPQELAPSGKEGEGHGGCESENYIDPNDL